MIAMKAFCILDEVASVASRGCFLSKRSKIGNGDDGSGVLEVVAPKHGYLPHNPQRKHFAAAFFAH